MRARARAILAGARRRARRELLRAAGRPVAFALERTARLSGRRIGVALVYHRVGDPPGNLERELLPALASSVFAGHVRHLSSRYRVVAASDLLRATRKRRRGEPFPVAITFDDDLPSHVDVAAPLLETAGATGTFFLSGASLHAPHRFWWERVQVAVERGLDLSSLGLRTGTGAAIHELGRAIETLPPQERDEVDAELRRLVGPDPPNAGLRASDIKRLAAAGFEVGFHTRRHDPLPALADDELERAMRDGRTELEQLLGGRLRSIAYPHGRAGMREAAAARAAGFDVGFTGNPEPVHADTEPLLLGRLSPSYDSVGELALNVAWTLLRTRRQR